MAFCRPQVCNFIKKETLAQVFFCESYVVSKNNFFYRTSLVAASILTILLLSVRHTGKVGTRTLRWDPGARTLKWIPMVGPSGGTIQWDLKVRLQGGTLRWDPRVGHQGGTLRRDPKVGPQCETQEQPFAVVLQKRCT